MGPDQADRATQNFDNWFKGAHTRGVSRLPVIVAAAIAALVVAMVIRDPAAGSNWYGNTGSAHTCNGSSYAGTPNNMTSDKAMETAPTDLQSEISSATTYVRTNLINTLSGWSTPSAPAVPGTDLIIRDENYTDYCEEDYNFEWYPTAGGGNTPTVGAMSTCEVAGSGGRCDQHTVRISNLYTATGYMDTNQERILLCHEIGHAMGLDHRANQSGQSWGCMPAGLFPSGVSLAYTTHDKAHLNDFLGNP